MPVIEIDGLTKTYKSGHQALKRIDLAILYAASVLIEGCGIGLPASP